jgi:hypothetical protein
MRTLLLVPAVALLLLGAEGLYFAAAAGRAVATTCDRVATVRRSSPRLHVIGCTLDYAAAGYRQSRNGRIQELFVPARPSNAASSAAPLVVAIQDPAVIAAARSATGGNSPASNAQLMDALRHAGAVLGVSSGIDGLARVGTIERFRTRRILSGFSTPIAADAIVLDLRGQPDYVRPVLALAAGGLLMYIALRFRRRSIPFARDTEPLPADIVHEAEQLTAHPPAVEPVAPLPLPVLPRLMLLNLDVTSGPDAIENAPALGSRRDVIEILCGVLPGLDMDDRQRLLNRPDGSITLDLGASDPIATVIVEARGEGGAALAKEILLMTGWRAFAPKMGLFVGVEEFDAFGALAETSATSALAAED